MTYIEVVPGDIALANHLAHEVLGRSLDELPPQTRRLLGLLHDHVARVAAEQQLAVEDVRLSRRQIRDALGWGDTQLKVHLGRLVELEHVLAHRPTPTGPFVYELVADHPDEVDGRRFLAGLVDPTTLDPECRSRSWSGSEAARSGSGRPPVGGWSAPGRDGHEGENSQVNGHNPAPGEPEGADRAVPGDTDDHVIDADAGVVGIGGWADASAW